VEFINLIGLNGNYISKYNYTTRSIIDELESIKNDYLKLLPAFHDVKELVETI